MSRLEGVHSYGDYLLVKPQEVGLWDLIKLLLSEDIDDRTFLENPQGKKLKSVQHRGIVVFSAAAQKILLRFKKPLASLRYHISIFLNLPSSNGGYLGLLSNCVTGRVVKPDPSSPTFRSVIGSLDSRFDLWDVGAEGCSSWYNNNAAGALSIMAARVCYENDAFIKTVVEDRWKMKLLDEEYNFWNDFLGEQSTRAIMVKDPNRDPNLIVVAFQGTDPFDADAICTDLDISWCELEGVGRIHSGFMKALGLQRNGWPKEADQGPAHQRTAYYTIRARLKEEMQKNKNTKFIITGHSLGGALAILMAAVLIMHEEEELLHQLEGVYTFGQPRVGDGKFGEFMKEKMEVYNVRYDRYVYCNDIVPRLPYDDDTFVFKHFGPCIYYNSLYKGKVIEEAPNKNYFSWIWMVPKHLNAVWELVRGFLMPWMEGPDYREGWVLTLLRVVGLIIPGLAEHGPQDYHNITRLGQISPPSTHNKSA